MQRRPIPTTPSQDASPQPSALNFFEPSGSVSSNGFLNSDSKSGFLNSDSESGPFNSDCETELDEEQSVTRTNSY